MDFVNINGDRVSVHSKKTAKPRSNAKDESWHKGWKVVGIPPGQYEKECQENAMAQEIDRKIGGDVRPDLPPYKEWAAAFKLKPVRAKPYEIPEAANICKELAQKSDWDRVFVVEMKHVAASKP